MPRISIVFPHTLFEGPVSQEDEKTLCQWVIKYVTGVGNEFKKELDIRGAEDIWMNIQVGGWSNKGSVFGEIFMIPKDCRTEEVRSAFGDAVARAIFEALKAAPVKTKCIPGIDLPIRVVPRPDYIECDDQPFG